MQLKAWMDETGTTAADLADALGVGISSVYRWLDGGAPRRMTAAALQAHTGGKVTLADFTPQTKTAA